MIVKVPGKRAPLCDECHKHRATSRIVLDHELLRGRTRVMRCCDRCAVKVAREDAERVAELQQ